MRYLSLPLCTAALLLAAPVSAPAQSWSDLGKDLLKQQLERQRPAETTTSTAAPTPITTTASTEEIGSGLKAALKQAATQVTGRLGKTDGFNADPLVHIPLPGKLAPLRSGLALAGQSGLLDDLEVRLNRAAEAATPEAREIFLTSLDKMSLDDARTILSGPKDSATQYFKRTMTPDLTAAMRPVIQSELSKTGAMTSYQALSAAAGALPLVGQALSGGPELLTDHVLERALGAIFTGIGKEEAAIRTDPAKRSTDLLKKVFGG
ncbi:DUF4197 domain-containing protein [Magnetospirillum molischianum]|uniref:DUF4197 domain-containing protein n=1 Tax=Magnetospirillum molischianum DSM 120 TaxID=1150626 RepID=H8FQS8_MAGML|nr:DUF4197 domain-containing protein [Magnetospirillum molischianum]CCG40716.1 conserved exported hypothetical protein [Magnetospirillum molischianum DSM 120]